MTTTDPTTTEPTLGFDDKLLSLISQAERDLVTGFTVSHGEHCGMTPILYGAACTGNCEAGGDGHHGPDHDPTGFRVEVNEAVPNGYLLRELDNDEASWRANHPEADELVLPQSTLAALGMTPAQAVEVQRFVLDHLGDAHTVTSSLADRTVTCTSCGDSLQVLLGTGEPGVLHLPAELAGQVRELDLGRHGGPGPQRTADEVLATVLEEARRGGYTTVEQIRVAVEREGYTIALHSDLTEPEYSPPAIEVAALADRLPGDATTRVGKARDLLQLLAIDGWHLEPIAYDKVDDGPVEAVAARVDVDWQVREVRREAAGLAVQMYAAGQLGAGEVVGQASELEVFLSGRDLERGRQLSDELVAQAAAALHAYRDGTPDARHAMAQVLGLIVELA